MIIFDASNMVFSTVLDWHEKTKQPVDMHLLRHLVIQKLIGERQKLREYDDEVVICFDSRHYWRKEVFPYYKANRKATREKSTFDWDGFFPMYDQLKEELRTFFPVKCIEVHGAEADDCMAILAARFANTKKVVIVSSDKDLIQIQETINPKVKQYSPYHRKFLTPKTKGYNLFEHIVRGDVDDGVPNILSQDDVLVTEGIRQKPMRKKDIDIWARYGVDQPEEFCRDAEMYDRFKRNKTLVDLRCIPDNIANAIVEAYDAAVPVHGQLFSYMTANRLGRILANGGW